MNAPALDQALAFASHGWPVFPCHPGSKQPATRHGFRDATTDPAKIRWWWHRHPDANLAIATGTPGPDVLDIDQHGPAGNGFAAFNQLQRAGLTSHASAIIRTPSGGLHAYFTGSDQATARLPCHHLDFRAQGGCIVAPPSRIGGKPYHVMQHQPETGGLDWHQVTELLEPDRARTAQARPAQPARRDVRHLADWLATQGPDSHNRNDALFWAACRAAEAGDETALTELAAVASTTGLSEREISRTIASARHTAGPSLSGRESTS